MIPTGHCKARGRYGGRSTTAGGRGAASELGHPARPLRREGSRPMDGWVRWMGHGEWMEMEPQHEVVLPGLYQLFTSSITYIMIF